MDMPVKKKKLGLKEKYALMTRDLGWEPSYEKHEDVFPLINYEGLKIHDWEKWEDPFRLTMDSYWKYQSEKERKLYAIIDAYNQNNGHLNVTDARYINAMKVFLSAVPSLEYNAHRGFARLGRHMAGVGPQVACQMQAIDELRHAQTQIHALSNYNRFYNGFHDWKHMNDRLWYLSVPKSFFEDACTSGPFEFIIAISFSFEYVLTNLVFVPFVSGAAYNGDMGTMTFGFSAQSDEARHMTLGLEVIKFMLEQDPANLPIVQKWIDKWTWRGVRLLTIVAMMMDYMLPKRVMSWKEAWEIYFEENGMSLFKDLARYGVKVPDCVEQIKKEKNHISHQAWTTFYAAAPMTNFHTWVPSDEELDWLSEKYPETFDQYYRPRFEFFREQAEKGERFVNPNLPQLCQVCQIPMLFTEPDEPTQTAYRQSEHKGEKYHFCSDHCQHIFDDEPEKYVEAWLPVHQIMQGNCFAEGADPTSPDFNPIASVLDWWHIENGRDNGDFAGSEDEKNFAQWRGMATSNN
ncbi:aromatic/alkene/methane monooxygenase hydroxylase/oxygenase subunit alpha [Nitrogeniibacter aestuarii]|uniref:aromatic/alkene/methane monooxygenase hydroxylase/oxygenase subunit alpha n=1 Tax=Nitrogeniibacter aestuarii TaxID=2815343 RepID=UPI001E5232A8|nr:aromatic/alkene/methane monooxygenase hydroxylase/oxygenase subunit alpha [Nitrogeniibacter aestuarii]